MINLDDAAELSPPTPGWHRAIFTAFETAPNRAGTGVNLVFTFTLSEDDPDRPGMALNLYVPIPSEALKVDFENWVAAGRPKDWDGPMTRDGRHTYQALVARIRRLSVAFGGPDSGLFDPSRFSRFIGKRVKINLQPDNRDPSRVQIAFDGVISDS